jgi:hypothetical protein
VTCFGKYCGHHPAESPEAIQLDSQRDIEIKDGRIYLPFDPSQVVDGLRCESYARDWRHKGLTSLFAESYYFIRAILPVRVRRVLQKFYLRNWEKLPFPHWPLDSSVDDLLERLLLLSVQANGNTPIPFIWFWPAGAPSCAIVTHDVETELGKRFCSTLMDIDDSFGIKASFQIIPEERYGVEREFLASVRNRSFELVVHDLNHDGHLYKSREEFLKRVAKINAYGKEYGADGFRAGVLYRKQLWYDALKFSYDMSVPNVGHLDPQRGGCCTVMPYFVGDILELPVTTIQDYTLFHILNDYSTKLWKQQTELIMEKHGLMSFIVHPDYVVAHRERNIYEALLRHLVRLREEKGVWITTPGEVNRWWRQRAEMTLVEYPHGWEIEGQGKERARIAYASEHQGQLVVTLQPEANKATTSE